MYNRIKTTNMAAKRLFITLISLFLIVPAYIVAKNLDKDVTMVSYEQRWLDLDGTLALKNNTNEEIRNVVYQITYLDMSGNPLDYEDFTSEVLISPGMTKKVDIPAYEHSRHYHYYKSENMPGGSPAFKIEFKLKDYNVDEAAIEEANESNSNVGFPALNLTFILLFVLFGIGISVAMYVIVAVMAQKRRRNVVLWVLLSIVASPLLIIIILFAVGDNEDYDEE